MWGLEIKGLFSILFLKFKGQSREVYHSHAFNSYNWLLTGHLREDVHSYVSHHYTPSCRPIKITRNTVHKVDAVKDSWVFSLRGPWADKWYEFDYRTELGYRILTHGREVINASKE